MEVPFNPANQLTTLLGPKPTHPWGALIPQVLLWCFRRFCVKSLTEAYVTPITDELWDDHLELIRLYAPRGLESISISWMTPENIEFVHSLFMYTKENNEISLQGYKDYISNSCDYSNLKKFIKLKNL